MPCGAQLLPVSDLLSCERVACLGVGSWWHTLAQVAAEIYVSCHGKLNLSTYQSDMCCCYNMQESVDDVRAEVASARSVLQQYKASQSKGTT